MSSAPAEPENIAVEDLIDFAPIRRQIYEKYTIALKELKGKNQTNNFFHFGTDETFRRLACEIISILEEALEPAKEKLLRRLDTTTTFDFFSEATAEERLEALHSALFHTVKEAIYVETIRFLFRDFVSELCVHLKSFSIPFVEMIGESISRRASPLELLGHESLYRKFLYLRAVWTRNATHFEGLATGTVRRLVRDLDGILEDNIREATDFYRLTPAFINVQAEKSMAEYKVQNELAFELYPGVGHDLAAAKEAMQEEKAPICYSNLDLGLVLLHTYLFFVNFYGMVMSGHKYPRTLGLPSNLGGAIQGCMPFSATCCTLLTNRIREKTAFRGVFIVFCLCMTFSNVCTFMAEHLKSRPGIGLGSLIVGRVFIGIGGSGLMARKYVATHVARSAQRKVNTILGFVSVLGMCTGPGLTALLQFAVPNDDDVFSGAVSPLLVGWNILHFVLMIVWAVVALVFIFAFRGAPQAMEAPGGQEEALLCNQTTDEMRLSSQERAQLDRIVALMRKRGRHVRDWTLHPFLTMYSAETNDDKGQPRQTVALSLPKLQVFFSNWQAVLVFLALVVTKLVHEGLFCEIPGTSAVYYKHSVKWLGSFFVLSLFYAVPAIVLHYFVSRYVQDRLFMLSGEFLLLIACLMKINYFRYDATDEARFYIGSALYFAAVLFCETGQVAVIGRTISPRMQEGYWSVELFACLADGVGRTLGAFLNTAYSYVETPFQTPFYQYIIDTCLVFVALFATSLVYKYLVKHSQVAIDTAKSVPEIKS